MIAVEAPPGGFVGPVREGHGIFESGTVIAGNGELFEPLCKVIRAQA